MHWVHALIASRLLSPHERTLSTILTLSLLLQNRSSLNAGCQMINVQRSSCQIISPPATPLALVQEAVLEEILRGPRCESF